MNLYTYDLDSLVYMSPQIIEGELGSEHRTNNFTVWNIKVSKVHNGILKVGQTVEVTALDFFRKPAGEPYSNTERLKEGDKLFLFLDRAKDTPLYNVPKDTEIYWPVPSGVRLVMGAKAVGFSQYYGNPGPYVAESFGAETNTAIPTVTELRGQIRESAPRTDKWKLLLNREASTDDIPQLLQLLIERRSHKEWRDRDDVAETICVRLANLHDFSALAEALRGPNHWYESSVLGRGFGTPAGREFLLATVADEGKAIGERIQYANLLTEAGGTYRSKFQDISANSWRLTDSATNSSGHYLKRIAQLATRDGANPDLQLALLKFFQRQNPGGNVKDPALTEDIKDADTILESFLKRTAAEDVKYELEMALNAHHDASSVLNSTPIISILRPRNPRDNYKAPQGRLSFEYNILTLREGTWTTRVALVDVKSGRKWNAPTTKNITKAGTQSQGSDEIALPTDLPHSHYHVFYEYVENGNIVSSSHFFETDL